MVGIDLREMVLTTAEQNLLLSVLGECALALEKEHYNRKRAEAATKAKNEQLRANLLRSISHDLRTPLTSISGARISCCKIIWMKNSGNGLALIFMRTRFG